MTQTPDRPGPQAAQGYPSTSPRTYDTMEETVSDHDPTGSTRLLAPEEDQMAITRPPVVQHDPPQQEKLSRGKKAVAALLIAILVGFFAICGAVLYLRSQEPDPVAATPPAVDTAAIEQAAVDKTWANYQAFRTMADQAIIAKSMDGFDFDAVADSGLTTSVADTVEVLVDQNYTAVGDRPLRLLDHVFDTSTVVLTVCMDESAVDVLDASGTSVVQQKGGSTEQTVSALAGPGGSSWKIGTVEAHPDRPC